MQSEMVVSSLDNEDPRFKRAVEKTAEAEECCGCSRVWELRRSKSLHCPLGWLKQEEIVHLLCIGFSVADESRFGALVSIWGSRMGTES